MMSRSFAWGMEEGSEGRDSNGGVVGAAKAGRVDSKGGDMENDYFRENKGRIFNFFLWLKSCCQEVEDMMDSFPGSFSMFHWRT